MSKKDSFLYSETDWQRLDRMTDEDIDVSDVPELAEEDFKRAKSSAAVFRERGIAYPITSPVQLTIHKEGGTTETFEIDTESKGQIITLDPDVSQYFPDSESVNRTLRSLIALIPEPHPE